MDNIVYDCRWSDEVDEKFIADFIATENAVFHGNYTVEQFRRKYMDNIYGKSVVEVVYLEGKPVAARGLWRNDIGGQAAYQPGDTCVTEVCRGKGIFTEMTKRSIAMLADEDIVYNFPNQNSFPGYMKMGWKLIHEYGMVLFTGVKKYLKEHPVKMDDTYADWWLEGQQGLYGFKCGREYFLVRKRKPFCYDIRACVSKETAQKYKRVRVGLFFYRSTKNTFYNKKLGVPIHVVSRNDMEYIPVWKMDAI